MSRDLGRAHIISFAVGIVGLIVGIVGIVLAIVFGTSQTACPTVATSPCNTNLFSIQTGIQNMNWTDAYKNKQSPEYKAAVGKITNNLESSLNAGLNPSSSSLVFAVLSTTGPSSNNVKVEVLDLRKGDDGYTVIAVGNGAISSAKPNTAMPTNVNVTTVIKNDPIYVPSTVNTGPTTSGASTAAPKSVIVDCSTVTQTILSTTSSKPASDSVFKGRIVTLFELNAVQVEIQNVVNFVSSNLYNSANYDFTTKTTEAINVPYGETDQYSTNILNFGDALSLDDLQSNIDNLYENAVLTPSSTVSEGLQWLNSFHPTLSNTIIVVAGNHHDDNFGLTSQMLHGFRARQNKFISVAIGETHGDLSSIADRPEWYFQVGQYNGQSVADQISSILLHL